MGKSLESISQIASDFCEDMGDSTESYHVRYMKQLLKGYKKINMYLSPELAVKSQIFPVDGQIELPCDFIYETKIGLMRNGCLVTLDINRNLRLEKRTCTDSQILNEMNSCWDGSSLPLEGQYFYNTFRRDNYVGELYGFGSGYHSNTWYNITDGVLQLSSIVPDDGLTELVIEYKSDGLAEGFKLVPTEMVPYMEAYANKKWYQHTNRGLYDQFNEEAKVEYFKLKKLYSYRPPEYLAWLFKSSDAAMRT